MIALSLGHCGPCAIKTRTSALTSLAVARVRDTFLQYGYRVAFCLVQLLILIFCATMVVTEVNSDSGALSNSAVSVLTTDSDALEPLPSWTLGPCSSHTLGNRLFTAVAVFMMGALGGTASQGHLRSLLTVRCVVL